MRLHVLVPQPGRAAVLLALLKQQWPPADGLPVEGRVMEPQVAADTAVLPRCIRLFLGALDIAALLCHLRVVPDRHRRNELAIIVPVVLGVVLGADLAVRDEVQNRHGALARVWAREVVALGILLLWGAAGSAMPVGRLHCARP